MAHFNDQGYDISIIQVYAPTTNYQDEVIDAFYSDIQGAIGKVKPRDVLMIMGDFNAKVGNDSNTWDTVLGRHGIGEQNERGERLLQFFQLHNMSIMDYI